MARAVTREFLEGVLKDSPFHQVLKLVPVKGFLDTRLWLIDSIKPPVSRVLRSAHAGAGRVT